MLGLPASIESGPSISRSGTTRIRVCGHNSERDLGVKGKEAVAAQGGCYMTFTSDPGSSCCFPSCSIRPTRSVFE